jgi:hypothetical protein
MINKCGCGNDARCERNGSYWGVFCSYCNSNIDCSFDDKQEAIKAWNTAHPDTTALTSERDELKRQVAVRDKAIDLVFEIFILHDTMLSEATRGMTIAQTKEWLLAKAEEQV